MSRSLRLRRVALLVCLGLLLPTKPARAETLHAAAVEIVVGIVAVTAVLTTAVILIVRHKPAITGCVNAGSSGLEIAQDGQTFVLTGDTASLKPGERVKVQGKRRGKDPTGNPHFFVESFKKDYGPCKAAPATP